MMQRLIMTAGLVTLALTSSVFGQEGPSLDKLSYGTGKVIGGFVAGAAGGLAQGVRVQIGVIEKIEIDQSGGGKIYMQYASAGSTATVQVFAFDTLTVRQSSGDLTVQHVDTSGGTNGLIMQSLVGKNMNLVQTGTGTIILQDIR